MRNAAAVAVSEESGKHCSEQCRHLLLSKIDVSNNPPHSYIAVTHHASLRVLKLLIGAWRAEVIFSCL